jgi:hypothetical protein
VVITLCFAPETVRSSRVFATLHAGGRWLPEWLVRALISPVLRIVEAPGPSVANSPPVASIDLIRPHLQQAWSTARI